MLGFKRLALTFLVAVAVGGCATGGVPYKQEEAKLPTLAPGNGRVFLYRDSIVGFAIQPEVTLNGAVIGTAKPNVVFYVDRPKGNYEVATSTEVEKKATFTLDAGEVKYVRLSIAMGLMVGRIVPELVDAETAKKAMSDLDLVRPTSK